MKRFVCYVERAWFAAIMSFAFLVLGAGCAVEPNVGVYSETPRDPMVDWLPAEVYADPGVLRSAGFDKLPPRKCFDVQFPPANEPDGCSRRLVTMDNTGTPFDTSSTEPALSRNGTLVAFTKLPPSDEASQKRQVHAAILRKYIASHMSISINNEGELGDGDSFEPSVDGSGQYVAFTSYAQNLTADPPHGYAAIFVRDLGEETTTLVSRAVSDSAMPNGNSFRPLISSGGRYVIFLSSASNLVDGDTNDRIDLFMRDRMLGTTERLSVDENGDELSLDAFPAAGISDTGRYVVFSHPSALTEDAVFPASMPAEQRVEAYRLDRVQGELSLLSRRAGGAPALGAYAAALSADGNRALLYVGSVESLLGLSKSEGTPGTVMANMDEAQVEFGRVYIGSGVPRGMSANGQQVVFTSTGTDHGPSVQLLETERSTSNAYVRHRDLFETRLLTANRFGVPGVIHNYIFPGVREQDWVSVVVNGDGNRFAFSSIQYGLVDYPELVCRGDRLRMIYVVTCGHDM